MNPRALVLIACIISCSHPLVAQQNSLEKVDASDFFDANAGSIVYIEISDSQVLVFSEDKNSQYVLHGRPLEIHATNIEVNGTVVVRSFSESDHGKDTTGVPPTEPQLAERPQGQGSGDNGAAGSPGHTGSKGSIGSTGEPSDMFRLYLRSASGAGTIAFNSSGMKGGKGQEGGRGQNGQKGGKGHDRGGSDSPGDGGNGGDGGVGGEGGDGGQGGPGGKIIFDRQTGAVNALRLVSPASPGGEPGTPGLGGTNGGQGEGGGGHDTRDGGRAGTNPGVNRQSQYGPVGATGATGAKGEITCSDCAKPAVVETDGKIHITN